MLSPKTNPYPKNSIPKHTKSINDDYLRRVKIEPKKRIKTTLPTSSKKTPKMVSQGVPKTLPKSHSNRVKKHPSRAPLKKTKMSIDLNRTQTSKTGSHSACIAQKSAFGRFRIKDKNTPSKQLRRSQK